MKTNKKILIIEQSLDLVKDYLSQRKRLIRVRKKIMQEKTAGQQREMKSTTKLQKIEVKTQK